MSFTIRFTRTCRAELIRLFGALAGEDIAFAEAEHAALTSALHQLGSGAITALVCASDHPELRYTELKLNGLSLKLVFAQEPGNVLTLLTIQI